MHPVLQMVGLSEEDGGPGLFPNNHWVSAEWRRYNLLW